MAKLVFGMNQSLDGYVEHLAMETGPELFRHWTEPVRDLSGSVYGRRMYDVMRYWDEDDAEWDAERRDFAAAWRSQPKWVVSRSLKSVGPNATLVQDDLERVVRGLKAHLVGEIAVSGPELAQSLTDLVSSMSIDFTSTLSCLAAATHSSPARGRRSALRAATWWART